MRRASLAVLLLVGAGAPAAIAQQAVGPALTTTVTQRLEADTNYGLDDDSPGTSYFADSRLRLDYQDGSPVRDFSLNFDTGLRALWQADEDFEFAVASPTSARLGYDQEWSAGVATTFEMRYAQRRVDFDRPLDGVVEPGEPLAPEDIGQLEGDTTERRYDLSFGADLARDAPSSYSLRLAGNRYEYSDVTTDRTPRSTISGGADWILRLTPILSSVVSGNYLYYSADNASETRLNVFDIDAGVLYQPGPNLRLGLGLGYADRTRKDLGQPDVNDTGPLVRGNVNYAFEDFTVSGTLVVSQAAPETRANGSLQINYPLPRGFASARIYQNYTSGSDGDEIRVAGAGFGLTQELTAASRLRFDFTVAQQENLDNPNDPDVDRIDATATYTHALTPDIGADLGYRIRKREEGVEDATSHAVFFQISRAFQTRF